MKRYAVGKWRLKLPKDIRIRVCEEIEYITLLLPSDFEDQVLHHEDRLVCELG